ncbi:MAG: hypothetical protein LUC92_00135 [Clostridiales bacterium]|nr:hypothetical protein [Clostridiales bacterium]
MKRFLKTMAAALTLLSVLGGSALTAWGEEIQLTDYRYESGQILKHDYVLLDYEVPLPGSSYPMHERQIWNVPGSGEIYYNYICWQGECLEKENQRTKRPVSLLSPDGTVAFKPGKYVMYYFYQYTTGSRGEYGASVRINPQGAGGKYYAAYDIDTHKSGILDKDGNIAVDFIYTSIQPFDKLFLAYDAGETTYFKHYYVINPENGKVLFKYLNSNDEMALNRSFYYYISEDGNYFAVYGFTSSYAVYMFCGLDGNIIDSSNNASRDECEEKFLLGEISYHHSETIQDKDGRVYNRIIVGAHDENTVEKNNLRLRTKEIGGKTYYAVFRELEEGENEADYRTYDEPSSWAKKQRQQPEIRGTFI